MAKFVKKTAEEKEIALEVTDGGKLTFPEDKVAEEVKVDAMQEEKAPEVVVSEVKIPEVKVAEVVVTDAPQEKPVVIEPSPTMEAVIPNKSFRMYIGNKYYDFTEGVNASVPIGVVFELREQGNID